MSGTVEVLRAGALTTVQDLGRAGWAHLGVPRSGALDAPALRSANGLVGNPDGGAGLEVTVTGCTLRFHDNRTIAVTGAAPASITVDDRPAGYGTAVRVPAGGTVVLGAARWGVRTYLAIGGGIALPPVLGSRSTDTLSGLGPARLRDGDLIPLGPPSTVISSTVYEVRFEPPGRELRLRIRPGPRDDWFTAEAMETLCGTPYSLSPMSNRVGARLVGATLRRVRAGELDPEGLVLGAVQVTLDGQPLVFLADHPTTGGYPVIAVVEADDVPWLAQARPGTTVRFHGPQR